MFHLLGSSLNGQSNGIVNIRHTIIKKQWADSLPLKAKLFCWLSCTFTWRFFFFYFTAPGNTSELLSSFIFCSVGKQETYWTGSPGVSCRPQSHQNQWSDCCRRSGRQWFPAPYCWEWNLAPWKRHESLKQQFNALFSIQFLCEILQLQTDTDEGLWAIHPGSCAGFHYLYCILSSSQSVVLWGRQT